MSPMEFGLSLALATTWIIFVLVAWVLSLRISDTRESLTAALDAIAKLERTDLIRKIIAKRGSGS